MAEDKKQDNLHVADAAYIAGIIDGEGTVTLSRKHKGDNPQLVISIANTDYGLLDYMLTCIGTGKITRKRTVRSHHTPSATYAIENRQALDLLEQVFPYLRTYKKERARLILKYYIKLTPRNGKYTEELATERQEFVDHVLRVKSSTHGTSIPMKNFINT